MPTTAADRPDVREQLVRGALELIASDGTVDLSVRRLAQAGGRSTMCVYSKFGSRRRLLEAVYERAAAQFLDQLDQASDSSAMGLASAYRAAAAQSPGLYTLLMEQPLAALELDLEQRRRLIDDVIDRIQAVLGADSGRSTAFWATLHGLVTFQQTWSPSDPADSAAWSIRLHEALDAVLPSTRPRASRGSLAARASTPGRR
jgi:AcrR family transcriptional regulator